LDPDQTTSDHAETRPDPGQEADPSGRPDVEYKGAPLDAEKGPGLGCFWLQVIVLAIAVVLTPLSAAWNWPVPVIIVLLATTLVLLLFVGQTIIFLLRLVAADRRSRRRPLASGSKTVGELEDERTADGVDPDIQDRDAAAGDRSDTPPPEAPEPPPDEEPVRQ
jgi:hypothetical protein